MKRLICFRTVPVAAAVVVGCVLLAVANSTSGADGIEYAWRGTIVPVDVNQDPWEIGAAGKPFFVSVTLDEVPTGPFATDADPAVEGASFESNNVAFVIDGESAEIDGNGFALGGISFFDHASYDDITIRLYDVHLGVTRVPLLCSFPVQRILFSLDSVFVEF